MSDLLSTKYLFLKYLPSKFMIFIVPVALILMVMLPDRNWHFLLIFSFVMVFVQISQFYICKNKHENLLSKYGDVYEQKLKSKIETIGVVGLLNRYWVGLEPDEIKIKRMEP